MTESLANLVDQCDTLKSPCIASADHFAVQTVLQLSHQQAKKITGHCFQKPDWEKFKSALQACLTGTPTSKICMTREFDN